MTNKWTSTEVFFGIFIIIISIITSPILIKDNPLKEASLKYQIKQSLGKAQYYSYKDLPEKLQNKLDTMFLDTNKIGVLELPMSTKDLFVSRVASATAPRSDDVFSKLQSGYPIDLPAHNSANEEKTFSYVVPSFSKLDFEKIKTEKISSNERNIFYSYVILWTSLVIGCLSLVLWKKYIRDDKSSFTLKVILSSIIVIFLIPAIQCYMAYFNQMPEPNIFLINFGTGLTFSRILLY